MITRSEIENEINEFCPEFNPIVDHHPMGFKIMCRWGLTVTVDPRDPIEITKFTMYDGLMAHIGKLTVLAVKLEEKLKGTVA